MKLLTKMYEPSSGVIVVDDTPLSRIAADDWRLRAPERSRISFDLNFWRVKPLGLAISRFSTTTPLWEPPSIVQARKTSSRN